MTWQFHLQEFNPQMWVCTSKDRQQASNLVPLATIILKYLLNIYDWGTLDRGGLDCYLFALIHSNPGLEHRWPTP